MNCDSCQMLYYTKRRVDYSKSVILQFNTPTSILVRSVFSPARKKKDDKKKSSIEIELSFQNKLYLTETRSLVISVKLEILFRPFSKGATSRFPHLKKFSLNFSSSAFCNPCQSSPSLTISAPLWFVILSLCFSNLGHYYSQFSFNVKVTLYVAKIR